MKFCLSMAKSWVVIEAKVEFALLRSLVEPPTTNLQVHVPTLLAALVQYVSEHCGKPGTSTVYAVMFIWRMAKARSYSVR